MNRSNGLYNRGKSGYEKIILLLYLVVFSSFILRDYTGTELLTKTIAYHDPKSNWEKFKAKLYLNNINSEGKASNYELEIDNKTGYFCHISHKDEREIVKGFSQGKEFFLLDGKSEFSEEERKKYKLTSESVKGLRNFYGYLYGLPMKLTDAGVIINSVVSSEEINGKSYPTIRVNYDPAVGTDNWFFYCDAESSALKAYRFNHGKPESGEYILLEEELKVDGIKFPKIRKWYLNKDNKYLGTDNLLRAEKLTSYRR